MKTFVSYLYITFLLGLVLSGCENISSRDISDAPVVVGQLAFCGKPEEHERYDIFLLDLATRKWANLTEKYAFKIDDSFGHSIGCYEFMRPYGVSGLEWSPNGEF